MSISNSPAAILAAVLALAAATPTDAVNGTTGWVLVGVRQVSVRITNTGANPVTLVQPLYAPQANTPSARWGNDTALAAAVGTIAAGATRTFSVRAFPGQYFRLQLTSTLGTTVEYDVVAYDTPTIDAAFEVDGAPVTPTAASALSGNVSGVYTLAGTPTLGATMLPDGDNTRNLGSAAARYASVFAASLLGTNVDAPAAGALNLGPATATSVAIGSATVAPSFPGGLSVGVGKSILGGAGALTMDTTGALNVGTGVATSVVVGSASVAPSFPGGLTTPTGKGLIGAGTLPVDTTGNLSLGSTTATAVRVGRAAGNVGFYGNAGVAQASAATNADTLGHLATWLQAIGLMTA